MILKITKNTDNIWKQKFKEIGRVDTHLKRFVNDMKETLEFTNGVGLAAPQVGFPIKLLIANYGKLNDVFVNPKILEKSKEVNEGEEGCLSVPGHRGLVNRPNRVTIRYQDMKGRVKEANLTGFYARIIQHEFDHLNSTFYINRIKNKKKLVKFSPSRLVFFGTPEFGATILKSTIGQAAVGEYEVLLVVTQPDSNSDRGQKVKRSPVKGIAIKFGIPTFDPLKLSEKGVIKKLKDTNPDIFIVASYGQILPKSVLTIPKYGSLNVHASLLPKYRGASPIQSAILNKDKVTGVTIMLMNEKLDEGEILAQAKVRIGPSTTAKDLEEKLAKLGAQLLHQVIHLWINKRIKPRRQLSSKVTYTKRLTKDSGYIDWKKPPKNLESMIRAYFPWPGAWTNYNGKILKLLPNKKVQLEGKQPVELTDFKQGHKDFDLIW